MGILITTDNVGDVIIQGGHGAPDHIATRGTLYTDWDAGVQYINKNGINIWGVFVDSTNISGLTTDNVDNVSNVSGATASDALNATTIWLGNWYQSTYIRNQQVLDGSFLAIANKTTEDRPAPQAIGSPSYIYTGTMSTTSVLAKQVIFGNRYLFDTNFLVEGWRINVIAGNNYIAYLVQDPTGTPIINQIINFTAQASGWVDLNISKTFILSGSTYDFVAVVSEPDPTPTTFNGNWDYLTPTNITAPSNGQITHANKDLGNLRISKIDNDAINQASNLSGLTTGDIISVQTTRWAIQSSVDNGTYFTFAVSPATQLSTTGVKNFRFETVTPTPITYPLDTNHWTNFPPENVTAQGLLGIDVPYLSIVPNGTAYGIDILTQEIIASPDWDLQAYSPSNGRGSGGNTTSSVDYGISFLLMGG